MPKIITPDDPEWSEQNKGPLLPPDPDVNQPIIMGKNADKLTPKGKIYAYQEDMDLQKESEAQAIRDNSGINYIKHATSLSAFSPDPWYKVAQQSTGVDNMMTNPMWFSPLHTPQSWQIASKRREVYQWSFITDDKNQNKPCYLTNYDDFSLINIKDVYKDFQMHLHNQKTYIQNANGEKTPIDMATKRYVKKQANEIKSLGIPEPIVVTCDHDCIVIKREDILKNCMNGLSSSSYIFYNCKDHETKDYKISKIKAKDVKEGDCFLVPFPTEVKNSIIKTKAQARCAGRLASDGGVSSTEIGSRIRMGMNEVDSVLPATEKTYNSFGINTKLTGKKPSVKEAKSRSKKIYEFSFSLVKGKQENKRFTEEVLLLDPKLQLNVLGSYIQHDGSYNKKSKSIEITTCSPHLTNQLMIMFYRCKILAYYNKYKISSSSKTFKTTNKYRYIINIPSSYVYMLRDYIPGKIPHNFVGKRRTYNKRFFWRNYVVTPVISNTSFDYEGPVYDVRAPKNFTVTANGVGIHQCRFFFDSEPKVAAGINFYCFTPDTQISMAGSYSKSISEIKLGDMVISHDNTINKVNKIFTRYVDEKILHILVNNGTKHAIRVTKGHELFSIINNEIKKIQANKFKKNDILIHPQGNNYKHIKIKSITEVQYRGVVYDIEVDNAHSYIADGISCSNSSFPMNGFKLECKSRKILKYFERLVKRLRLNEIFKQISTEYFTLGDVFIHLDIECPLCNGTGRNPDEPEKLCNHKDGTFKKIIILNPDWIEVRRTPFSDDPAIVMVPDEDLKRIVHQRTPKILYDRIPDSIKDLVRQNKPIPLSNRTTSHLKHMAVPYGVYGTSLVRRLFTTLAYKTKIMTANWIVAERLIIPVRVVKVGSDDRPASSADIADIQNQLAQTANDPNMTIVTHNNFDYSWYGACHDQNTEVLTDDGFKTYDKVDTNSDKIICYDVYTKSLKSMYATKKHVYDYDDEMICFNGKRIDIMVTPNHKMLSTWDTSKGYKVFRADEIKHGMRFLGKSHIADNDYEIVYPVINKQTDDCVVDDNIYKRFNHYNFNNFNTNISTNTSTSTNTNTIVKTKYSSKLLHVEIDDQHAIPLDIFSEFAGYYLSEGTISCKKSNYRVQIYQQKQNVSNKIEKILSNMGYNNKCYRYGYSKTNQHTISSKELSLFVRDHFGHGAPNKYIPYWMKNLPVKYLHILLDALMSGDGHRRNTKTDSWVYTTVSSQLADDIQEISIRCGYASRKYLGKLDKYSFGNRQIYRVHISRGKNSNGSQPVVRKHNISRKYYKGKVWCLTVPTGFFVTRRNGKVTIQGNSGKILQVTQEMEYIGKEILDGLMLNQSLLNGEMTSYASAQVGVETLIRRIESWRNTLAEWAEENIFRPVSEMKGFVDKEESEEIDETIYLYPTIKWNDLNLKDKTQWHQILLQLFDKQLISQQTLMEELDLDYDQEVKRQRWEMMQAGPAGAMMQPGGAGGPGGMSPMGGIGGGAGGGMPPPGEGAGGMPGGEIGMGGAGEGAGMGAPPGGIGAPGTAGVSGKIMKKGKEEKKEEMAPQQYGFIKLTQVEQKLAAILHHATNALKINYPVIAQLPVKNPKGNKPYSLDFAIPQIKLGFEADGEIAHSSPDQVAHDKERDMLLAKQGWTILRFDDQVIDDSSQQVASTIVDFLNRAVHKNKTKSKTSANIQSGIRLYKLSSGKFSYLGDNYDKYNEDYL